MTPIADPAGCSWPGRSSARPNDVMLRAEGYRIVFIERLWRSLKHEDVYLKGYADSREARAGISSWISFYNGRRPQLR